MFFGKRQIIGIDLGASSAKAVLLERKTSGASFVIRQYAMVNSEDPAQPLDELLRRLLRKLRTRCRDCAVSAWPSGARLRFFDLRTEQKLERAMKHGHIDASVLFHEELEGYAVECGQVTKLRGVGDSPMAVACGVPRAEISKIEKALSEVGCKLRLLQLAPVAILNAFAASQADIVRKQPFLLVDFGRARMTVIGGMKGSVHIVRRFDFPWGEFPPPLVTADDSKGEMDESENAHLDEAFSMVFGSVTDSLATELRRMLESIQREDDFSSVPEIYVSGALSNNSPVIRHLGQELEIRCVQWNPFRHIAAHRKALSNFSLLSDLAHLPAAAGAAFQYAA